MTSGLRVGIASQTPLVRMKREVPLPEPVGGAPCLLDLATLQRGLDYSVTPGGVARMVYAFLQSPSARSLHGEWAALGTGFGCDLQLGSFRLSAVNVPPEAAEAYKEFKEIVWEAINGLPPKHDAPLTDPALAGYRAGYEAWSRANTRRLLQSDAEEPFDVFYVNDWQMMPAGRMLEGKPRVMHFHAPIDRWTPSGWRDFILHHFRGFDGIVVSTRSYARHLEQAGMEMPIHQVYPWLDPREQKTPSPGAVREVAERFGVKEGDRVILSVARMDPVKAQDRLIKAFALLAPRFPDAKLVCIGNGSFSSSKTAGMGLDKGKVWRGKLEGLVAELGLKDRVVFTGHLPQADVETFYHRADVFAFPSAAEGFGLAVVEAWLAGKPAVVNPGAGISEIIRHGENSLLADSTDPRAFADALAQVLASPDGGRAMGEEARRAAWQHCDVRKSAKLVRKVLDMHASGERVKEEVAEADEAWA